MKYQWSKENILKLKKTSIHPLIGIGGINTENAKKVLTWGLDGIAVISEICGAKTLELVEKKSQQFKKILEA